MDRHAPKGALVWVRRKDEAATVLLPEGAAEGWRKTLDVRADFWG